MGQGDEPEGAGKGMSSGFKYWQRRERRRSREERGGASGRSESEAVFCRRMLTALLVRLGSHYSRHTQTNRQTNTDIDTETHKHRHLQRHRSEQCTGTTCCCGRWVWRLCKQMVDCYIKCEKHAACSCQKKNNSKSSGQSTTSRYPVEESFGQFISKPTVQYLQYYQVYVLTSSLFNIIKCTY